MEGNYHGFGTLFYHKQQLKFVGIFSNGSFQGRGKLIWKDGFSYEGIFYSNQPTQPQYCIHPKLQECIEKGICTSTITAKDPTWNGQVLAVTTGYRIRSKQWFCEACIEKGCSEKGGSLAFFWDFKINCKCPKCSVKN
eukprot:TRINITY_DN4656_c0_g2_i1.p1 TRINITY_DN4656_c0_g2~~TRINITY_DN4656_c0_g2_i1.p1  ORF type:complete len:138 (-),score=21.35 TRINITY_DN4656_c0_g2_i1:12-425(-)